MAVFERTYRRYTGDRTALESRPFVLTRYAFKDVFRSRFVVAVFALSFLVPLIGAVLIYAFNNMGALAEMGFELPEMLEANATFFEAIVGWQGRFAFLLALIIGPGLVSRDLVNNALPLYLARPLDRVGYVVGKMAVLGILLSVTTWIPALFLFIMQSSYAGVGWAVENIRIAGAMVGGAVLWIVLLSLLALAMSAWVKWRTVGAFLMFMIFAAGGLFALMANGLFSSTWGYVMDLGQLMKIVFAGLLGTPAPDGPPMLVAMITLTAFMAVCVFLLDRKIRAYEVVG
ncbi:MAG: hypothetical protein AAGD38_08245 [Acidobacteriota bacterium]